MPITKTISGAQTGADQGGLDAAIWCDVPYGGWIPKGRKCESGRIPDKYEGLRETKPSDYLKRTEANVRDSDCTVVFTLGSAAGGPFGATAGHTGYIMVQDAAPFCMMRIVEVGRMEAELGFWLGSMILS